MPDRFNLQQSPQLERRGDGTGAATPISEPQASQARVLNELVRQTSMERLYAQVTGHKVDPGKQLCPFHDDHSPSLQLYEGGGSHDEGKPHFHCFSCQAHGDAADFVSRYADEYYGQELSIAEIISALRSAQHVSSAAERYPRLNSGRLNAPARGVKAREQSAADADAGWVTKIDDHPFPPELLFEVIGAAHDYWHDELMNSNKFQARKAREYLQDRNIDSDAWKEFNLGFVPPLGKQNNLDLWSHLVERGYGAELQWAAGLLGRNEDTGKYYTHFTGDFGVGDGQRFSRADYGRVMFPIHDFNGNPIGGAARLPLTGNLLAEASRSHDKPDGTRVPARPKFKNGRNTSIYENNNIVFNCHRVREPSSRSWLMVEGYPDALMLHMKGFLNVVSAIGTKISEHQLNSIWAHTDTPIICLDGDRAGRLLSIKRAENIEKLVAQGRVPAEKTAYFVLLPDGKDPDELVRNDELDLLKMAIARPVPLRKLLEVVRAVPPLRKEQVPRSATSEEKARIVEQNKTWKKEYDDRRLAALDRLAACCVDYSRPIPPGCERISELPEGIELAKHVVRPNAGQGRKRSLEGDDGQQQRKRSKMDQGQARESGTRLAGEGAAQLIRYVEAKAYVRRKLIAQTIKIDRAMSFETNLHPDGASCERAHAEFVNTALAGLRRCYDDERAALEQFAAAESASSSRLSKGAMEEAFDLGKKLQLELTAKLKKLDVSYSHPRSEKPHAPRQPALGDRDMADRRGSKEPPDREQLNRWLTAHSRTRAMAYFCLRRFEQEMAQKEKAFTSGTNMPVIPSAPGEKYLRLVLEAQNALRTREREACLSASLAIGSDVSVLVRCSNDHAHRRGANVR